MTSPATPPLTLGIHASSRGFGWAALEGPLNVFDHAVFTTKGRTKNARCLAEVESLLDRLKPECLVLEAFDGLKSQRSARIRGLYLAIVSLAADQGLTVVVYSHNQVKKAFAGVEAQTRDEIAEAVARHLPPLTLRLPNKRGAGDSEDKRLSIFNAAALVLTHYHHEAAALLVDLRDAA